MKRNSFDTFTETFTSVTRRPFDRQTVQIVSSADSEPDEIVTVAGSLPITDERGEVIFLEPGTLTLGMICVLCMFNASDSCEPDEDSKAMSDRVRADYYRHMEEVHGAVYDDE
jgi:hypothetical protein